MPILTKPGMHACMTSDNQGNLFITWQDMSVCSSYSLYFPRPPKSNTNLSGYVQHVVDRRKQAGWMSPFMNQPLVFISSAREDVLEIDWLHLTTFSPEGLAVIAGLDRQSDQPVFAFNSLSSFLFI